MKKPLCLIAVLYYEASGKALNCGECPMKEKCEEKENEDNQKAENSRSSL